ncbi:putative enzyme related to lactoylglutathione lyase [Crossiella equi]|uniref:Enzyme related to lactoylglutathione lyase n=1 Tax=Crossiella equi TaxID=130796 RepID=A0ABS5AKQ4_9PSEU|nr:VOC family protein [Crossiella equi]MBP2477149.1 putative enzyme related to lactoylglutathione lyase [Crossiella equi]
MTEQTRTVRIGMVTIDCADPRALAGFWTAALGTTIQADHGGEYVILAASPGAPALGLQRVPEERAGKNRVHLDLVDGSPAEIDRLVGLGAQVRSTHEVPGFGWTVLTDPEGNEFCVADHG